MDSVFYAFAVFVFAAVILGFEGAFLWWSGTHGGGAARITRRLNMMANLTGEGAERISILKQRRLAGHAGLDRLLRHLPFCERLEALLVQAGVHWSVAQVLATCLLGLGMAMLVAAMLSLPWPLAMALVSAGAAAPVLCLLRMRGKRLLRIEEQLPEAADFIARALRAGHSFTNVLQMAGAELPEPLSGEFRATYEEIHYGLAMNEALHHLAARIPLTDLRYMVIAVLIQRESGGNLAEILGSISHIIRSRLQLLAQVRVLSAEGRISAWILGSLPFAVLGIMALTNPGYVGLLWTDPTGIRMLWYGIGLILVGVMWLRRLIRIRV